MSDYGEAKTQNRQTQPMSATTSTPPAIGAPNSAGTPTTIKDQLIGGAKDLPDLIAKAKTFDPDLAASLTGKALIASKSPWGSLLGGIVTWLAAKEGLGWDETTCNLVAGAGVLVGAYLMRWITKGSITGIVSPAPITGATP
jgi:hypothetical protein